MALIDPYTEVAGSLEAILKQTFAAENIPVLHDRLHASLGHEGAVIGISPDFQRPQGNNELVMDTDVLIQFYGRFDLQIDPKQTVDPRIVTGYAARFRHALMTTAAQGTNGVWYFKLTGIEYPNDPTGNKTRFEARVRAKGDNAGLVESIG